MMSAASTPFPHVGRTHRLPTRHCPAAGAQLQDPHRVHPLGSEPPGQREREPAGLHVLRDEERRLDDGAAVPGVDGRVREQHTNPPTFHVGTRIPRRSCSQRRHRNPCLRVPHPAGAYGDTGCLAGQRGPQAATLAWPACHVAQVDHLSSGRHSLRVARAGGEADRTSLAACHQHREAALHRGGSIVRRPFPG